MRVNVPIFCVVMLGVAAFSPVISHAETNSVKTCDNEGSLRLRDLQVEAIQIANNDVAQMLATLATLGYRTISVPPPASVKSAQVSAGSPTPYLGGNLPGQPSSSYPAYPGAPSYGAPNRPGVNPYVPSNPAGSINPGSVDPGSSGSKKTLAAQTFKCDELPVVVMPPQLDDTRLGFTAGDFLGLSGGQSSSPSSGYGGRGASSASVSGDISPALHEMSKPHTGEVDHLLVFYHEEDESGLIRLRELIRTKLDLHASQIYIEGLVLEVSEEGLSELGIQYKRTNSTDRNASISVGTLNASPLASEGTEVLSFVKDSLLDPFQSPNQTLIQLQSLVSDGSAEVLSRPSVLTLNNRQATIQIIDIVQFPIQEATITASGDIVQSAFTFEAIRPGITLNLRPRVSAQRDFVSLEIDVTVEALVSANSGEVRNDQGQVIATKPGSSARRVQTFARIPDRTPIIIGGLISSDREDVDNRVPVLSKVPLLGKLFGATRKVASKREVIIVLTPYVVGDEPQLADVSTPKDTSLFDIHDNTLFHDSYRIRNEDIYDLRFLKDGADFTSRRSAAEQLSIADPSKSFREPYRSFLEGRVPGGEQFLSRMIFDLVNRRDLGDEIKAEQLIVLEESEQNAPVVALMSQLLDSIRDTGHESGLVITFDSASDKQGATLEFESRPQSGWSQRLWDLSYGAGEDQYAIILRDEQDVDALVTAMISASILNQNGGYEKLSVGRFRQGTLLSIPTFAPDRFYLIDKQVARVFTDIQHYYRASAIVRDRKFREFDEVSSLSGALVQ